MHSDNSLVYYSFRIAYNGCQEISILGGWTPEDPEEHTLPPSAPKVHQPMHILQLPAEGPKGGSK